ncbi:MAG: cysteine hydrolase [Solirubrobacterales bacterium]|jgi:nicotinamidase-related amidase|nr:cysteine hydrolase [Solirubrobacterales bacterium]
MATALIVVDMLNDYEHEDAEPLMASAREVVPGIRSLVDAARQADVLTVYVNDNHGDWAAGRTELTRRALAGAGPSLVEPIAPGPDIPLLVKARHSAFYATQLEHLLHERGIERLMLTGQVTEQCILYSALDAYVRGFQVIVPGDAVAHIHEDLAQAALRMIQVNMRADVVDTEQALATLRG